MGHVRIDKRGDDIKIVFYVGNGRKDIPRRTVVVQDVKPETLVAVIEPVLAEMRKAQRPLETVQ